MLRHFLRAGGAVQPDQRHVERVNDGGGGGDIRADQQGAGGFDRNLHEHRHVGAGFRPRDLGAVDGGLDLQRVLACLDDDRIHAAGDEAAALFGQRGFQRVIADSAQGRQFRAGAEAAQHPAVPSVAELLGRLAREFAGALVDLEGLVGDAELAERDGGPAERVGLRDIGPGLEVAAMDLAHEVGAGKRQHVGAVLMTPVVALDVEGQRLRPRTHRAVAQQDAVAQGIQQVGTGHACS